MRFLHLAGLLCVHPQGPKEMECYQNIPSVLKISGRSPVGQEVEEVECMGEGCLDRIMSGVSLKDLLIIIAPLLVA
jgi:hypothetical protein